MSTISTEKNSLCQFLVQKWMLGVRVNNLFGCVTFNHLWVQSANDYVTMNPAILIVVFVLIARKIFVLAFSNAVVYCFMDTDFLLLNDSFIFAPACYCALSFLRFYMPSKIIRQSRMNMFQPLSVMPFHRLQSLRIPFWRSKVVRNWEIAF